MSNTVMLFIGIGLGAYMMNQKWKTLEAQKAMRATVDAVKPAAA